MLTRVQRWGNSQGIRLPKKVLSQAEIAVGEEVDVKVENHRIVVEAPQRVRGRYRIEDLAARMPEGYSPSEEDWGEPIGREVW